MSDLQHILVGIKNTAKDGGINSEVVNATIYLVGEHVIAVLREYETDLATWYLGIVDCANTDELKFFYLL